jgi:5-methyltetrahydrofolate--homocysteine methyltransferase
MTALKRKDSYQKITDALKERILILDGAMGTMIQRYKLEEEDFRDESLKNHNVYLKGNNDLLAITRPDVISEIHKIYFESGADFAETNTFSGTTIAQADYELEHIVDDINFKSAQVARKVADEMTEKEPHKPRWVIGSMGPTNKTASMSPDVNDPGYRAITFEELVEAFEQQAIQLIKGGVDVLMLETLIDTLNAKAGLYAIQNAFEKTGCELPIMVSGTITDASGRILSGQTAEAFLISMSHGNLLSIGFNCALGAKDLRPHLQDISNMASFNISAHPNAGLPNEFGQYDESPEDMVHQIQEFFNDSSINIIGGCCGTTPQHIQAIANAAAQCKPRPTAEKGVK